MTHKIKVKMLQGVDLTPSTKTYLFRTALTGLAQGDIVKANTTNGVQLAKVVKYCDKSPNVPTQDVFERVPESKIQTVQNEIFNLTARNSPTSKVAGCKGFGLVQGLAPCA